MSNSIAPHTRLPRCALAGIASFLILLGCVSLAARYFPDSWLQAILFGTPIPRYNVSIAFIACGIALIGTLRDWTFVTVPAAIMVLVIGGARLAEYLTGFDLRNDDFLWLTRQNAGAPFPVGMTLAVAFAFPIAGIHLILSVIRRPHRGCVAAMELFGFLVIAIGIAGMIGQIEGGTVGVGWSAYTRMSLLTAAGLIALGIGLSVLSWEQRDRRFARISLWLPMILLLGVGLFVYADAQSRATDRANVHDTLELRAAWRALNYEFKIASLVEPGNALALLVAAQLRHGTTLDAEEFGRFARQVRGTNPVGRLTWSPWVEGRDRTVFEQAARRNGAPDYAIRTRAADRLQPLIPAPQANAYAPVLFAAIFGDLSALPGYDFLGDPVRRSAAERARDEGRIVATPPTRPIERTAQEPYFTVFVPVYRGDAAPGTVEKRRAQLLGFVTGTFPLPAVMEFAIRDTPSIPETLSLFIDHVEGEPYGVPLVVHSPDSDSVEIGQDPIGDSPPDGARVVRSFLAIGQQQTLVFDFSPAFVSDLKAASRMELILGLTLMLVIAGYIAIEQRRRKAVEAVVVERTRELVDINEALQAENEGRQIAQAALVRTGDELKAKIDESRQSALRLAAVVDNAVDGLINIDERGVVEAFNPACERIFGYAAAEVIGRNVSMLMQEPDSRAHNKHIARYVATGESRIIGTTGREVNAKRKDGSVFAIDIALGEFTLTDGHHFCGIVRDITARKLNEEKADLLAAVVASSDDAIMSKTIDGIVTSWNAGAEHLFGYRAEEAVGQSIRIIVPPDLWADEERITAQIRDGKSLDHYETVRIDKAGRRIDISVSISPIRDNAGKIIGAAKVARDITARKRQDATLAHHVTALERSNKELDDFAYIASHDLKEPLRGLFNNAKFLNDDYAAKLDEAGVARLLRLGYLCQRMEQLVNDLLYFSRLGRQDLAIQPTDLNAVIRDIETMSETLLTERNVTIVIPQPLPQISCDKTRIAEVFRNLITNAAKYNDNAAKRIEIGYLAEVTTKDGLEKEVFYVKDNGIGIDAEFFEEIFRIFKRLNAEDDDKKGTGVGLTFVRKIVERHGGRIWLTSVPSEGSTFYFTIDQGAAYEAAA